MAREPGTPTAAAPYAAIFTAANLDVTSTTATTAPVELSLDTGQGHSQGVNLVIGGVTTGKTYSWQLILYSDRLASVMRVIEFTTAAGARRSNAAGNGGLFMHADKIVDLGGLIGPGRAEGWHWYLALAGIDTDTGAHLIGYSPIERM